MKLNHDYDLRVRIETTPALEEESQVILESDGEELAATTWVTRYRAGDVLDFAQKGFDTEIIVLEGSIEDGHDTFPAGTYLRNPSSQQSAYTASEDCLLFVKQRKLDEATSPTVHRTYEMSWYPGMVAGLSVMPLQSYGIGNTALVKWAPNTIFNPHKHWGGEEILVLEGVFRDDHGEYPKGTWIRSPHLSQHAPFTGPEGAVIFVKTGHL